MLEKLYTTKMSADKKIIENRFSKIRLGNSRFSKVMTAFMTAAVIITMLCANVVMAMVDGRNGEEHKISIYKNGEEIELTSKPFVENGDVYVPLREVVEKIVSEDEGITDIKWNNGTIDVKIAYYQGESGIYRFDIGGSYMGVQHFAYSDFNNVSIDDASVIVAISFNQSPMLKSSTAYVTIKDINYMLFGFTNRRNESNELYEIEYSVSDNEIEPEINYIPIATVDTKDVTSVLNSFLKSLYRADYTTMTSLCTANCVNTHFEFLDFSESASVFGIHRASVKSINWGFVNKENDYSKEPIIVTLNCELPSYSSANGGEREIKIFFEKQPDGTFLISDFAN